MFEEGSKLSNIRMVPVELIFFFCPAEEYLQLNFDKALFTVSAIMHPSTYLNKILLGSEQGPLQLWNIKSK